MVIGSQPSTGLTSESIADAREGEQMKCRQVGLSKGVLVRSEGVMRTRGVRYLNLHRKIEIIAHMSELDMLIVKSTVEVYTYPRNSPRYKFSALVVPLVGSSLYSHISLP